jgi:hypothetical protein
MSIRQIAGVLYIVTALVSGYWEFNLTMRPLVGGPSSWWYPVTLGASVVLLVGGVLSFASQVRSAWLVVFLASLLLGAWWVPASAHTLRVYFSPRPPSPNPSELLWALTPAVLVIACLVAAAVSRSFGAGGGYTYDAPK